MIHWRSDAKRQFPTTQPHSVKITCGARNPARCVITSANAGRSGAQPTTRETRNEIGHR